MEKDIEKTDKNSQQKLFQNRERKEFRRKNVKYNCWLQLQMEYFLSWAFVFPVQH